jgi:hypothetical protein
MSEPDDWKARRVQLPIPVFGNGVRFISSCGRSPSAALFERGDRGGLGEGY